MQKLLPLDAVFAWCFATSEDNDCVRNLKRFQSAFPKADFLCLCNDPDAQLIDGVHVRHWKDGLKWLGLSGD